jgi:hypothetical protein
MRLLSGILVALLLASCAMTGGGHATLNVAGADLAALVRASDAIVVGVVSEAGGLRNIARDPKNLAQEDPNFAVLAQDYGVSIESTIKGGAAADVIVTVAQKRAPRGQQFINYDEFQPLVVGARYALFLRKLDWAPGVYAIAFEPSRFKFEGDRAVVQSPWNEASSHFPAQPTADFLQAVRAAVSVTTP